MIEKNTSESSQAKGETEGQQVRYSMSYLLLWARKHIIPFTSVLKVTTFYGPFVHDLLSTIDYA